MKIVQAVFFDVWGPIILWNLLEAIPGHPKNSTVSSTTLAEHGMQPPPSELARAMLDPRVKSLMNEFCSSADVDWAVPNEDEDDDFLADTPEVTCELTYDPSQKPGVPQYPLDISKQVPGYAGATNLHCQMWIREWFHQRKGRQPDDDFVAWCVNVLETGGAVLLVHKSKPE